MRPPLALHLIHHPDDDDARAVADHLLEAINGEPVLTGLHVPTWFAADDGTGLPPTEHRLDDAEKGVVALLVGDKMVAAPDHVPPGRQDWAAFAAALAKRCAAEGFVFLPIALSPYAWPLHADFKGTSFVRAYDHTGDARLAFVERRIVLDLARTLAGTDGQRAPFTVFVSHTKLDLDQPPHVFRQIAKHLDATQPVRAWVDAAQIDGGSQFAQAIDDGVRRSALLVLLTDQYGSRTWCRKEVLLAKEHGRPVLVVDAMQTWDRRLFPYLGNVPVIAWADAGPERVVTLLLKEALRHACVSADLARQADGVDVVLPVQPELATLVSHDGPKRVLYPDPPLGDEEQALLANLGHTCVTPLQRVGEGARLTDKRIALSVSDSGDLEALGMRPMHLNDVLLYLSQHLLARGASLAYGGHLGGDSYTRRLFDLVQAHGAHSALPPAERVVNYVGWPIPAPTDTQRAQYRFQATFRRVPRPDGVADLEPDVMVEEPSFFGASSPARRYAWARGMTAMREVMAAETSARIVVGGKFGPTLGPQPDGTVAKKWYLSRIPGVIEEALIAMAAETPLYLVGGFGGCGRLLAELVQGRRSDAFTWAFQREAPHAAAMRDLYEARGERWWSYDEMAAFAADRGVAGLNNGLTDAENHALFTTRDPLRVAELVLQGLSAAC